jgi:serine protease Do
MTLPTTRTAAGWLAGLSLGCLAVAAIPARPAGGWGLSQDEKGPPGIQRLDATQLADLEARLQKLYARLAPSVVRIASPKRKEGGFSGVIVSPAGEILTCAHHHLPPKTKVTVELSDGRKVRATILGSVQQKVSASSRYPAADVGTALLDEPGEWPAAKLGRSADVKPGELCLALGYPNVYKPGQPPLFRVGRMLAPNLLGKLRTTCRVHPGDSGGPLCDLEGRVLGVHHQMESLKTGVNVHSPIEGFLKLRDRLRAGEEIEFAKDLPKQLERRNDPGGAWEPTEELTRTLNVAHHSTVEVLGDGQVVALGLIVAADGWVLTKRTELMGPGGPRRLVCRLADGTRLEAQVRKESREHDLALLQVPAKGLPAVRWGKSDGLSVGQLIASLDAGPRPLHYGVVAALRARNPGIKGDLPFRAGPAPEGMPSMVFTEFVPKRLEIESARGLLKAGDRITHLDDVPTPTRDEFVKVRDKCINAAEALAGEWVKLTVERDGKTRQVYLPLVEGPAPLPIPWQDARWNGRRNGFPNVFVHDGGIAHDRCGGPVVDRSGRVIGVNIARADAMQSFAIPSETVQKVLAELLSAAGHN